MNEEERRMEILKAEAAISELAERMARACIVTTQAENAKNVLLDAVRSIDELSFKFQESFESGKRTFDEESKSLIQAQKSLDLGAKDFQKAQERLEKITEIFENRMEEKSREFNELLEAKMGILSHEINTISNKILFIIDQNEASSNRIFALQQIIEELSWKFHEFGNDTAYNSDEVQELRNQVIDSNKRLSSLELALEMKSSGISHSLRSAIIGGGLGMAMVLMIIKFV